MLHHHGLYIAGIDKISGLYVVFLLILPDDQFNVVGIIIGVQVFRVVDGDTKAAFGRRLVREIGMDGSLHIIIEGGNATFPG